MSALPQDPSHFVAWRRRHGKSGDTYDFAPRREWACYLDDTLSVAGVCGLRKSFPLVAVAGHLKSP